MAYSGLPYIIPSTNPYGRHVFMRNIQYWQNMGDSWGMYDLTLHNPHSAKYQHIWLSHGRHVYMRNIQYWQNMGDSWGNYDLTMHSP